MPAEQQSRLVAAAQMLGVGAIAEPPEIDDALDPLRASHPGKALRRGALPGREIPGAAPSHRVDQVVGGVDAAPRPAESVGPQHVALVQIEARALERLRAGAAGAAHEATHVVAVRGQPGCEHAADEPGGAGDQNVPVHAAAPQRGISTRSMTWMTPLEAAMFVLTTRTPPTVTNPWRTRTFSNCPFSVLTE